jgi:hypothetical protein
MTRTNAYGSFMVSGSDIYTIHCTFLSLLVLFLLCFVLFYFTLLHFDALSVLLFPMPLFGGHTHVHTYIHTYICRSVPRRYIHILRTRTPLHFCRQMHRTIEINGPITTADEEEEAEAKA